jgi:hypothetical protein
MNEEAQNAESESASKRNRRGREVRPLTSDERASFIILSLYMATFCIAAFAYWDSQVLKILGVTAGSGGLFLFVAAFFNTEAPEKSKSIHPLRSYLISIFLVLATIFLLRFIGGLITHMVLSVVVLYTGLLVALVVFRKAMIQVISAVLALTFLVVTVQNREAVLSGELNFVDTVRICGKLIFQIGPIQDVANMLIAGNYVTYLNRIDYRSEQINTLAVQKVARLEDDELRKSSALLDFVSNDIYYVSDPNDGLEYAKDPITTLIAGAGDCEDQTLLLCSLLESVGVKTLIAFTDHHVFALVCFSQKYPNLDAKPYVYLEGKPCYAMDPSDPGAILGQSIESPENIKRVFDVRGKMPVTFTLEPGAESI